MISRKHRFIYLHVPKTGGNSIQKCLQPFSDDMFAQRGHQDGQDRFDVKGAITPHKHARLADYAAKLGSDLPDYRLLISVRHPVDRAVSFYFSPHRWMTRSEGTNEWSLQPPYWDIKAFETCLKKLIPMVTFLSLDGRLVRPDRVIRFETLRQDFLHSVTSLGISAQHLPHVNTSAAPDLMRQALDNPEVRRRVAEQFEDDFRFFDY